MGVPPNIFRVRYTEHTIEMILNSFIMHLDFVQARQSLREVLLGKIIMPQFAFHT